MVNLTSTEEENTEFLKSLWDKYKYLVISTVLVIILSIIGIERNSSNKEELNQITGDLYTEFLESIDLPESDSVEKGVYFIDTYPDSIYAKLISLHLAKIHFEQGNIDKSEENLTWIIKNSDSGWIKRYDPIEVTAKYRLAEVLLDKGDSRKSLELLDSIDTKTSSMHDLIGDCYASLGENEKAKISYLKALESSPSQAIQSIIKMKLADIN